MRNSKKAIVEQTIVLSAIEQLNAGGSALATSTFVSDMLRARKYVIGRHGDRLDLLTVEDNGEIIDVAMAPAFSPLVEIPEAVADRKAKRFWLPAELKAGRDVRTISNNLVLNALRLRLISLLESLDSSVVVLSSGKAGFDYTIRLGLNGNEWRDLDESAGFAIVEAMSDACSRLANLPHALYASAPRVGISIFDANTQRQLYAGQAIAKRWSLATSAHDT